MNGASFCFIALIVLFGCARNEPDQKSKPPNESTPAAVSNHVNTSVPAEPHLPEGSGVMVWAKVAPGQLIAGLDGGVYAPYNRETIERVQMALRERGLYAGSVNGILDWATMQSIYAFQEAHHNVRACGVPTPRTRKMLEQGSHTDPSF